MTGCIDGGLPATERYNDGRPWAPGAGGRCRTVATDRWRGAGILAGLFLLSAGFIGYVIVPASTLPLVMASFGVGKAAASASISVVFLTWAALQIPGGFLLDRHDNRRLVVIAGVVFLLSAATGFVVQSYEAFLLSRLVSGASAVFFVVGSVNVLTQVLPEARQSLGIGVFIASPPFGAALGQFAGPRIADAAGWRMGLLAGGALGLLGLILVLALLDEPVLTGGAISLPEFATSLRNPSVLLVSVASLCTYAVWTFLLTWMPTYGTEVLGIELAAAGAATALVPLAGIASRIGGGWLSELLGGRLRVIIAASFVSSIALLYLLSGAPSPTAFAVLLALAGAAVNLSVGLYLVYVNLLTPAATQGTGLSVLLTFSQVGNLLAPVAGGWAIDQLSWTAGFGFAAGLAVVGLASIGLVPLTTS